MAAEEAGACAPALAHGHQTSRAQSPGRCSPRPASFDAPIVLAVDRIPDDLQADRVHVAVLVARRLFRECDRQRRYPIAAAAWLRQLRIRRVPFDLIDMLRDLRDDLDVDGAGDAFGLVALEGAVFVGLLHEVLEGDPHLIARQPADLLPALDFGVEIDRLALLDVAAQQRLDEELETLGLQLERFDADDL